MKFGFLMFCSISYVIGYFAGQSGGILYLFDFDEGWVKKQNAKFKKVFDVFFK